MIGRFAPQSLFSQLALSLGLMFLLFMLASVYWVTRVADQRLDEVRRVQALGHAHMLADVSRDALLVKDYLLIENLVQAARPTEGYAYAMLTRPDGTVLVHTDPGRVAHQTAVIAEIDAPLYLNKQYAGRPVREVVYPSRLSGRHLANAHVAYFVDSETLLANQVTWWFALAPLVILILFAGLSLQVVRRKVTDPIDRLTEVIATSSLDKPVQMPTALSERSDEIGSLARAFQGMSMRLHQTYTALARDEQRLQEAVEQRTALLQQANQEMEAFSYSVSHDLRAPLRAIEGFSQAIVEDCLSEIKQSQCRDYFQRIQSATTRMGDLIDDLLKLSRLTRQELMIQEVDLTQMARGIIEALHNAQPDRRVELIVAADMRVKGDGRLLRIALQNLLDNAWKFTRDCVPAVIEVGMQRQGERWVYFVRDNGAGFDPAYSARLFKPFQRLHGPREFEGTGIGLAIVQRVIMRHGGQVWAEATPGGGAHFRFTLSEPRHSSSLDSQPTNNQ